MSEIVLVIGEDWEGLYIDGKLRRETHLLTADVTMDVLGIEYEYVQVGDHRLFEKWDGRLPPRLATVREDLAPGWPG